MRSIQFDQIILQKKNNYKQMPSFLLQSESESSQFYKYFQLSNISAIEKYLYLSQIPIQYSC